MTRKNSFAVTMGIKIFKPQVVDRFRSVHFSHAAMAVFSGVTIVLWSETAVRRWRNEVSQRLDKRVRSVCSWALATSWTQGDPPTGTPPLRSRSRSQFRARTASS